MVGRIAFIAVLLIGASAPAFALPGDRDQPIRIVSERVDVDHKQGVNSYYGNVKVTQGSLRIDADKVIVRYRGHTVESVAAEGTPATFQQRLEGEPGEIKGSALRMDYNALKHTLQLSEDAKVRQGEDVIVSPKVHYNIQTHRLQADGSPENRVYTVLQPRKTDQDSDRAPNQP